MASGLALAARRTYQHHRIGCIVPHGQLAGVGGIFFQIDSPGGAGRDIDNRALGNGTHTGLANIAGVARKILALILYP